MSNIEVHASEFETPSRPTTSDKKSIHTPFQAIRKHCLATTSRKKTTRTPIASIRAKCVDCAGGSRAEVKSCELTDCALWPYRHGRRPAGGEA